MFRFSLVFYKYIVFLQELSSVCVFTCTCITVQQELESRSAPLSSLAESTGSTREITVSKSSAARAGWEMQG